MDFAAERERARAYLNRYYTARSMRPPPGSNRRGAPRLPYAERWAIEVEVQRGGDVVVLELEVHVPRDFPLHPPRVYLGQEDHARLFPIPHVDDDRFVCTFDGVETLLNPNAAGDVAVAVVEKAVSILEAGLASTNGADFDLEILAYWSQAYAECGPANSSWLSVIQGGLNSDVVVLTPRVQLGRYTRVIHANDSLADRLKATLDANRNTYAEAPAFSLGTVSLGQPPFDLRNGSALALVESTGRLASFKEYLRTKPDPPTVVFQAAGTLHLLGWQHASLPKPRRKARKGFHAARLSHYEALRGPDYSNPVQRIRAEPYTPGRLHDRTTGTEIPRGPSPRLFVAGLGAIGARLADNLTGVVSSFGLLDPDVLTVENIGRHLLGLDDVGRNKALALATRFRRADPLVSVTTISDLRLAEAINLTPTLLDGYDRSILALGDLPTEQWFDAEMAAGRIPTPTLFLWVEPLLAGGHCVYVRPGEARLSTLFENGRYLHDVIPASQHEHKPFTRREAGCQTTFVPYADTSIRSFLAAIYRHVLDAIQSDNAPSFRLRWTGDLKQLKQLGVEIAEDATLEGSFYLSRVSL